MGRNPAEYGSTPADSIHFLLKESGSTSRIDNPSTWIPESRTVNQLPHELITEILVRLPVKSLLRFKCVSKPWLSLISDPQFIRTHFSKSSSMVEADGLNLELLLATETGMKKCCLYSALHEADPSMHLSAIEFPAQNIRSIVGIINGLFCLNLKGTDLCVWNPALNKIKHLNAYPEPPSGRSRMLQYFFSFGYDEPNDDYKVVCLQSEIRYDGFDAEVRIYSLKADSWRRIDLLKGISLPNPGVFAYGKIYWSCPLMVCRNSKYVSLDLSSEKFAELQPPKYEHDAGYCRLRMGESGGRPFALCEYSMKVDLWVLDKRELEESWCKLVSIPYTDVNHKLRDYSYRVLCILSEEGEIVFGNEFSLLVYNRKRKEYRSIKLDDGVTPHWRMAAYVESLVWPNNAA